MREEGGREGGREGCMVGRDRESREGVIGREGGRMEGGREGGRGREGGLQGGREDKWYV